MKRNLLKPIPFMVAASAAFQAATGAAGDSLPGAYDKIWGAATIHTDKDSPFLQKLAFTGRLQYDYAYFDEKDAGSWDGTQWRRARAGLKATLFRNFTLHGEIDMDLEDADPVYNRLTDAYLAWSPGTDWSVRIGKQSAGFTLDGATSSKSLITTERSKLNENIWFPSEYFTGITLSGDKDNWTYTAGVFSNDRGDEFEDVGEAEYFLLLSLGHDFAARLDVDRALLRLDYVHNEESASIGTRPLQDILSLSGQFDNGRQHLWTDLAYAESFTGNEIWGFQIMPFLDLTPTFQLAAAYVYLSSSANNGLLLGRYERRLVAGRGDQLQDFYLGLNTYLYGHKLKWQNGLQYTVMNDAAGDGGEYDGIGFTSALRISW